MFHCGLITFQEISHIIICFCWKGGIYMIKMDIKLSVVRIRMYVLHFFIVGVLHLCNLSVLTLDYCTKFSRYLGTKYHVLRTVYQYLYKLKKEIKEERSFKLQHGEKEP